MSKLDNIAFVAATAVPPGFFFGVAGLFYSFPEGKWFSLLPLAIGVIWSITTLAALFGKRTHTPRKMP